MESAEEPYLFGKRRTLLVVTGVVVGIFVASINQAMLIVSVPKIIGDLGGLQSFAWIFTIYFLSSTVTIPIWGKLSDQYGRRPLLVVAIVVFLVGSVVCAVAPALWVLFVGRALQGAGSGGIVPIGMAATADIMSPRQRGKWLGYETSVLVCAQVGGPALGGLITDTAGWRWACLISVPFGLISLAIIWFCLKIPANNNRHKLDYIGSVLLTATLVSGLVAITLGGNQYAWDSPMIVGLLVASAGLAVVFAFWEARVPEPIIPLSLYRNRTFVAVSVMTFVTGGCYTAIGTYLPTLAQGALGYGAVSSGLILTPFGISSFVFGSFLGWLMTRTGRFRWQLFLGPVVMLAGFILLTRMHAIPTQAEIIRNLVICGFGIALGNATRIAVQNAMPQHIMGVVMGGVQFARAIGGAVMLTVLGAVMTRSVRSQLESRLPAGSPLRAVNPSVLIAHTVKLTAAEARIVHAAIGRGIPNVFYVLMPLIVISFFAAFFVTRASLRNTIAQAPAETEQGRRPGRGAGEIATVPSTAPATQS